MNIIHTTTTTGIFAYDSPFSLQGIAMMPLLYVTIIPVTFYSPPKGLFNTLFNFLNFCLVLRFFTFFFFAKSAPSVFFSSISTCFSLSFHSFWFFTENVLVLLAYKHTTLQTPNTTPSSGPTLATINGYSSCRCRKATIFFLHLPCWRLERCVKST